MVMFAVTQIFKGQSGDFPILPSRVFGLGCGQGIVITVVPRMIHYSFFFIYFLSLGKNIHRGETCMSFGSTVEVYLLHKSAGGAGKLSPSLSSLNNYARLL